jgi:outer membrane autotransporter protein
VAQTDNQRQVAGAFDALERTATGELDTVLDALVFSSTPQALAAFDTASGEIHASLIGAGLRQARLLTDAMQSRIHAIPAGAVGPASGLQFGAWAAGGLIDGSIDGDGNAATVDADRYGFSLGVDLANPVSGIIIGLAGGYSSADVNLAQRGSSAALDGWHLGAYGRLGTGRQGFTASGSVAYSSGEADTRRTILVNTINRTATASYGVATWTLSGELRYGVGAAGTPWSFGPVATIDYIAVKRDRFSEDGAGSLSLVGGSDRDSMPAYGIGGFANWQGANGRLDASLLYDHAAGDATATRLAFSGAPTTSFLVRSPQGRNGAARANLSAEYALGGGWGLGAAYRGRFGGDVKAHSGLLTVTWRQ